MGAMRWLMIALLASLAALLLAVAGVARHIWLQRARLGSNPAAGPGTTAGKRPGNPGTDASASADESEPDLEI